MKSFRNLVISGVASILMVTALSLPVVAAGGSLTIPISTVVKAPAGSTHVLAEKFVDQNLVGMSCDVQATGENQSSVHPGNNLVITSGTGTITLEDVERAANVITPANGELVLGEKIIVTLIMGNDKVFSGGMKLEFDCQEQPKLIEVCRDGEIVAIKEDERKDTDSNPPCPVELVQICRDGKIVDIKPEERKDTDTDAPCVLGEEFPKELPNTGLDSVISGLVGASALVYGARELVTSRQNLRRDLLSR